MKILAADLPRLLLLVSAMYLAACGAQESPPTIYEETVSDAANEWIMPDVIVPDDRAFCAVRGNVTGAENAAALEFFLDFVEEAYEATDQWKEKLSLVSIDYADYLSFHILAATDCLSVDDSVLFVNELFEREVSACGEPCASLRVIYTVVPNSPVARRVLPDSEFRQLPNLSPVRIFEYYLGRDKLPECTVSFTVASLEESFLDSGAHDVIWEARFKYRMSIFDVHVVNTKMFVLFTRQCEKKQILVEAFLRMVERVEPGTVSLLGELDLDPDISAYRFSQTGEDELEMIYAPMPR